MAKTTTANPTRICDICGKIDDHPRHGVYAPGAPEAVPSPALVQMVLDEVDNSEPMVHRASDLLQQLGHSPESVRAIGKALGAPVNLNQQVVVDLFDVDFLLRHHDCCANAGCPTGSCGPIVAAASRAQGDELRSYIQKHGAALQAAVDANQTPQEG